MVQTVTFPLSNLNAIPTVSGLDDVTIDIPQVGDIREELDRELPGLENIRAAVREEVREAVGGLQEELPGEGLDIDIPGAEAVADAVLDRLDIQPGLFGPIEEPLDEVIRTAVRDGLEDLGQLEVTLADLGADGLGDIPGRLDGLLDDIEALQADIETVIEGQTTPDIPTVDEIASAAAETVVDELEALPAGMLLTDPKQFILLQLEALLEQALSDETRNALLDE